MPSQVVTAHTTAVQAVAERRNAVVIPTSMTIDNDAGAADRTIRIQDRFTPSVSHGVAAPVQTTVERFRVDVLMGDVMTLNENDLDGVKCLGELLIIADAIDANCHITVGYKHE